MSDDLSKLAAAAVKSHAAVKRAYLSALKHARAAGKAVIDCRAAYEAGGGKGWNKWADENIAIAPSTRSLYVKIAAEWDTIALLSDDLEVETINGARNLLKKMSKRAVENGSASAGGDGGEKPGDTGEPKTPGELDNILKDKSHDQPEPADVEMVKYAELVEPIIRGIDPANVPAERRDALVNHLKSLQAAVAEALAKLGA